MEFEYKEDGNGMTNPPIYLNWRSYERLFGGENLSRAEFSDQHLTNYQDVIVRLHATWDANKASASANHELIKALRKKIKKAKRLLK